VFSLGKKGSFSVFIVMLLTCSSVHAYVFECPADTGDSGTIFFVDEPSLNTRPFSIKHYRQSSLTGTEDRYLRFYESKQIGPTVYQYKYIPSSKPQAPSSKLQASIQTPNSKFKTPDFNSNARLQMDPAQRTLQALDSIIDRATVEIGSAASWPSSRMQCHVVSVGEVRQYFADIKAARDAKAAATRSF
jgi:hypothetical protein